MTNRFTFNKFGITEDPRGAQISYNIGERSFLGTVVNVYRCPVRGATILKVRHFDGSDAPEVSARLVNVLGYSSATKS